MVAIKIWPKEQNLTHKALGNKAFEMASNPKYIGYERGLVSMVYKFLIKNLLVVVLNLHQTNKSQMNFISQLLENLNDAVFERFFF